MDILGDDEYEASAPARRQRRRLRRHRLGGSSPGRQRPAFDDIMFRLGAALSPGSSCVESWHEQGESFWIEDLRHVYALRGSAACARARLDRCRPSTTSTRLRHQVPANRADRGPAGVGSAARARRRALDDFAARLRTHRPYVDAAADEARRERRAPRKRRRRIRGEVARGARRTYVVRHTKITCTPTRAPFASPRAEGR